MPEPTEADAAARAAAIESELQTSIDEARADLANEARSENEKREASARLESLESRLRTVEAERSNAVPAAPVEVPPVAPAVDDPIARLESKLDTFIATMSKPVEPVKEAVAAVGEAVTGAVEETADVVESVPVRTHAMFRKVIGGGRDG